MKKQAKKKPVPKPQTAKKRLASPGASPISGTVPPVEHRFKPGNQAAVGHGRPEKLADLQALIKEVMAESLVDKSDGRVLGTRAQTMVRLGLNKNPLPFLEYAFGKVKQETQTRDWRDDVIDLLAEEKITEQQVRDELTTADAESVIARARLRRNESRAVAA